MRSGLASSARPIVAVLDRWGPVIWSPSTSISTRPARKGNGPGLSRPAGSGRSTIQIALVEKITRRTSTSNARNGTNSGHALSHNRMIPGYFWPHTAVNSMNRSRAAASVGAV